MRKSTHTAEYGELRERLSAIRRQAGLSQRQLAAILELPHSWVAKVESGERRIDLVEFSWFCAGCGASAGIEANELMRGWRLPRAGKHSGQRGER
jgi:transcriptional regulator with XRE-family HTH domain